MSLDGAQLSFVNAAGISVAHPAKGRKFNVGSFLGSDLVLPDAERLHCEIQCDAFGRVTIYNHSCTAPIVLNDQVLPATAKRPLMHGARIQILDEVYTWHFPKADDVSTPERAPPEQAANSSPSLKGNRQRRQFDNRLTVHNFRYSINSDDEGNTSIESRQLETSEPENAAKDDPAPERSITSPAKEADETLPKVDLLEATQNKENTSTLGNKLMLQLCARSDVVITSFSPRETGVKIEKSFTCVVKPTASVALSSAPQTPKSVYNTPKSVLSEVNEDSCSRDLPEYSTPSTSKKALAGKRPTSMYLIDLTTPQKLRPTLSVTPRQTPSSAGVISVNSTDMSSDDSPLVIDITNSSTPSKTPSKQQQIKVLKTPAGATPKRTPQSLMKRALLTSAKKQIAATSNTPTTPQARTNRQSLLDARRQCLTAPRRLPFHPQPQWRTPGRRQVGALTSKAPQTSPRKRQSMSLSSPRDNKISMLRKTLAANAKLSPTVGMSNKLVAKARRSLNSPKPESPKRIASPRVVVNDSLSPDMAHDSTRELSVTFTIDDDDDEQNATGAAMKELRLEEETPNENNELPHVASSSNNEQRNLIEKMDTKSATDERVTECNILKETSREETLNKTFELNVSAASRDADSPTTDASIREQLASSIKSKVVEEICDADTSMEIIDKSTPTATEGVDKSPSPLLPADVIEDSICEEVPTKATYQEDLVAITSVHLTEDTMCEEVSPSGEGTPATDEQTESEEQEEMATPGQTPMPRRSLRRLSADQNPVDSTPRRSMRRASMDATIKLEQCLRPTRRASCSATVDSQTTAALATPKSKRRLTEELSTPSRKSQRLLCTTPKRAVQVDESVGDMGVIIEEDAGKADVLPIVTDEDYGTELPTKDADEPDKIDYHGMREMLKTPKSCSTPHFKGLREMVRTPKVCSSPILGNIDELLETPSTPKRLVTVSRVALQLSKAEATADAQDMYFKTPRGKNLMIPNDPASAVLKTNNKSLATTTEYDLNATNATLHLDKIFDDVLAVETTEHSNAMDNTEGEINVTAFSTAAVSEADPLSMTTATIPETSDSIRSEALMNICHEETSHKDPLTSTALKDGGKSDPNLSTLNDESYAERSKSPGICEMSGIQLLDQTTDSMFSEPLVVTGVDSRDVTLEETRATGNKLPDEKKEPLEEGSDTDSMVGLSEPLVLSDDEEVVEELNPEQIKETKSNDSNIPPKETQINNEVDKTDVDKSSENESKSVKAEKCSLGQVEDKPSVLDDAEHDLEAELNSTLGEEPTINEGQNNSQDPDSLNNLSGSLLENQFDIDLEVSSTAIDESLSQTEVAQTSMIYAAELSQVSSNIQGKETDKDDSIIEDVSVVEEILSDKDNKEDFNGSLPATKSTDPIELIESEQEEFKASESIEQIHEDGESMLQLEVTGTNEELSASKGGQTVELTYESEKDISEVNKSSIEQNKTESDAPENNTTLDSPVEEEFRPECNTTESPMIEESLIETSFKENKSEQNEVEVAIPKDAISVHEVGPSMNPIEKISEAGVEAKNSTADKKTLDKNEANKSAAYSEHALPPIEDLSPSEQVLGESPNETEVVGDLDASETTHESPITLASSEETPSKTNETSANLEVMEKSIIELEETDFMHVPDVENSFQSELEGITNDSVAENNASIVVESEKHEEQANNQAAETSSTTSENPTNESQAQLEITNTDDPLAEKLGGQIQDNAERPLNLDEMLNETLDDPKFFTNADESLISMNASEIVESDKEEEHAAETSTTVDISDKIETNTELISTSDNQKAETEIVSTLAEKPINKTSSDESVIDLDEDFNEEEDSIIVKVFEAKSKSLKKTSNDPRHTEAIDDMESKNADDSVVDLGASGDDQFDVVTLSTSAEKSSNVTIGIEDQIELESTNANESLVDLDSAVADIEREESVSDMQGRLPTIEKQGETKIEKEVEKVVVETEKEAVPDVPEALLIATEEAVVAKIENKQTVSDTPDVLSTTAEEEKAVSNASEVLLTTTDKDIATEIKQEKQVCNAPELLSTHSEEALVTEMDNGAEVADTPEVLANAIEDVVEAELVEEEAVSDVPEVLPTTAEEHSVANIDKEEAEGSKAPEVLSTSTGEIIVVEIEKEIAVSDVQDILPTTNEEKSNQNRAQSLIESKTEQTDEGKIKINENQEDKQIVDSNEAPVTIEVPVESHDIENVMESCLVTSPTNKKGPSKEYVFEESQTPSKLKESNNDNIEEKSSPGLQESTNLQESITSVAVDESAEKLNSEIKDKPALEVKSTKNQNDVPVIVDKSQDKMDLDASCSVDIQTAADSLAMDTVEQQNSDVEELNASGVTSELDVTQERQSVEDTADQTEEKETDSTQISKNSDLEADEAKVEVLTAVESKRTPIDEAPVEILDSDEEDKPQYNKSTGNSAKMSKSSSTIEQVESKPPIELAVAIASENNSDKYVASQVESSEITPKQITQSTLSVASAVEIIDSDEEAKKTEENMSHLAESLSLTVATHSGIESNQSQELAANDNVDTEKCMGDTASTSQIAISTNDEIKAKSQTEAIVKPELEIIDNEGEVSNHPDKFIDDTKSQATFDEPIKVEEKANQKSSEEIEISTKPKAETESTQIATSALQSIVSEADSANPAAKEVPAETTLQKPDDMVIEISSSDEESSTHGTSQEGFEITSNEVETLNQVSHDKTLSEVNRKSISVDTQILPIARNQELIMPAAEELPTNRGTRQRTPTAEPHQVEKPKRRGRRDDIIYEDVKQVQLESKFTEAKKGTEATTSQLDKVETPPEIPKRRARKSTTEVVETREHVDEKLTETIDIDKPKRRGRKSSADVVEIEVPSKDKILKTDAKQKQQKDETVNLDKPKRRGRKPSVADSHPVSEVVNAENQIELKQQEIVDLDKPKRRGRMPVETSDVKQPINSEKSSRTGVKPTQKMPETESQVVEETIVHYAKSSAEVLVTEIQSEPKRRGRNASKLVEAKVIPSTEVLQTESAENEKHSDEVIKAEEQIEKTPNQQCDHKSSAEVVEVEIHIKDKHTETAEGDKPKRRGRKPSVVIVETDEHVAGANDLEKPKRRIRKPSAEVVEATANIADKKDDRRRVRRASVNTETVEANELATHTEEAVKEIPRRRNRKASAEVTDAVETAQLPDKKPARNTRKASAETVESERMGKDHLAIILEATEPEKKKFKADLDTDVAQQVNPHGRKKSVSAEKPPDVVEASGSREKTATRRGRKATVDEELLAVPSEAFETTSSRGKSATRRGRKVTSDEPLATPPTEIVEVPTSSTNSATRGRKATNDTEPTPTLEVVESTSSSERSATLRGRKVTTDEPLETKPTEIVETITLREKSATRGRKATTDTQPLTTPALETDEATTSREKNATRRGRKATVDDDLESGPVTETAELKPKRRVRKASAEVIYAEAQPSKPTEKSTRRGRGASADVVGEAETAIEKKATRRGRKPSGNVDIIVEEAPQPKKTTARRGRKASLSAAADETEKQEQAIQLANAVVSATQLHSSEDELTPRRREGRNLPRKNYDETSDEDKPGSSRKARKPIANKVVTAAVSPLPKPATPTKQKSSEERAVEPVIITQTPVNTITPVDVTSSQKREGRNMPRKNYSETSDDEKPASSRGRRVRQPTIKALELLVDSASRPATPKRRGKAKTADSAATGDAETDEPAEKKIILEDSTPVPAKARGGVRGRKVHDVEEVKESEPAKRGARSRKESVTSQPDEADIEVETKQPAKRNARGGNTRKTQAVEDTADEQPPIKKVRGGARAKTPVVVGAITVLDVEEPKEDVPVSKRATAARGRNARVAKVVDVEVEAVLETPPSRGGRGRKVHFEPMEDSAKTAAVTKEEAPPPAADEAPKRATRSRRK